MTIPSRFRAALPAVLAVALAAAGAVRAGPAAAASAGAAGDSRPDHSDYDALLREYVTPAGVRYAAWRASAEDRLALRRYIERMQAAEIPEPSASAEARSVALAYWLNLYNAATLQLVLDAYPVRSIRDLADGARSPWEREILDVAGRRLTLDAIEHGIIRPTFAEPRIHFALSCAAKGCPPLRAEAYAPERLDAQLEDQARAFLATPAGARFDGKDRLVLSRIFEWYAADFEAAAGSVLAWVRPWVAGLHAAPPRARIRVEHADYDWALNDAP